MKQGKALRIFLLCWKIGEAFVKTKGDYRELYEDFRAEYDAKWKTSDDCGSKGCANKGKVLEKDKDGKVRNVP